MRTLRLKYENLYLIFAFVFTIIQIIEHIKNNITISNLIIEIVIFTSMHLLTYSFLYETRKKNLIAQRSKISE